MKPFQFRLEKALQLRGAQLDVAQASFRQAAAAVAEADRRRAELVSSARAAEAQVRESPVVTGADLQALGDFRLGLATRLAGLMAERAAKVSQLAAARSAMVEAQRRRRLLERLKERRLEEWNEANGRELEELASESFLSRWNHRRREETDLHIMSS